MLRIISNTQLKDSFREFKGSDSFGLQVSLNYRPIQFYNGYGDGSPIIYFYAHRLGYKGKVLETYELSEDTIIYESGQYLIDSTKYFDNDTPTNVLPDGNYEFSFGNSSNEFFTSEVFTVYQNQIDGSDSFSTPKVKHFENDPIVIFND